MHVLVTSSLHESVDQLRLIPTHYRSQPHSDTQAQNMAFNVCVNATFNDISVVTHCAGRVIK